MSITYDGKRVIQERNGNNTPQVSYTRGTDLGGSLEGAGGIGGLLARSEGSTQASYFADGNGNITSLSGGNLAVVASYRYDPYGNLLFKSGAWADTNVYRFSSKECHAKSGLYYYLYRWYSPELQRWITRDPLGELGFQVLRKHRLIGRHQSGRRFAEVSQGPNLYRFVRNSPTGKRDAFGLAGGYGPGYDADECQALLDLMEFLENLSKQGGVDQLAIAQQLIELNQEYNDNCPDGGNEDTDPPKRVPSPSKTKELVCKSIGAGLATAGIYCAYRCVRMIPSLFPPLWPTIPINIAVP